MVSESISAFNLTVPIWGFWDRFQFFFLFFLILLITLRSNGNCCRSDRSLMIIWALTYYITPIILASCWFRSRSLAITLLHGAGQWRLPCLSRTKWGSLMTQFPNHWSPIAIWQMRGYATTLLSLGCWIQFLKTLRQHSLCGISNGDLEWFERSISTMQWPKDFSTS